MNISIIGTGYVGLVTGACFADLGNKVICLDNDRTKVNAIRKGNIPIYEPGLQELVKRNINKKRIKFTSSMKEAVRGSDIIFICVGTPSRENGEADLTFIENVSRGIGKYLDGYKVIVEKSTVPVHTGEKVREVIQQFEKKHMKFDVASNPEFLREGSAIEDFMKPDRVVIGVESPKAREMLTRLYKPLNTPIVVTDIKGAEIIKHAANSFLATKISFINAISNICESVGTDVTLVARGIGLDKRINTSFLNAGIGYGGSCFPKDVDAFIHICEKMGYDFGLMKEVKKINEQQWRQVIKKAEAMLWNLPGKKICVLGLAFKSETDDIRSAPSIKIINELIDKGCSVRAYDPQAMAKTKEMYKTKAVKFCKDAYDAASGCDCIIIVTEWNEFKQLDLKKIKKLLKQPVVIDGRNIYDPRIMKDAGFRYSGIGRKLTESSYDRRS